MVKEPIFSRERLYAMYQQAINWTPQPVMQPPVNPQQLATPQSTMIDELKRMAQQKRQQAGMVR